MTGFIYSLKDIKTGEIFYVGSTINVNQRLWNHKTLYGQNISIEVLEQVEFINRQELIKVEGKWIKYFIAKGIKLKNIHLSREPIKFKADCSVRLGDLVEPLKNHAKMEGITLRKLILRILNEHYTQPLKQN